MATKKKGLAKPKRASGKKATAATLTTKRRASKRPAKRGGIVARKNVRGKTARVPKKSVRKSITRETVGLDRSALGSRSGVLSGDLQGLSDTERADSESVSELIEEGNAFEAGIVTGVEEAEDNPEREVQSREVPEDDVPAEYEDER